MAPFTSDIYTAMPMKYAGDEYFVSLISRERGSHPLFSGILEIPSLDRVVAGRDNTRVTIGDLNLELSMGEYDTIDVTTQEMMLITSNKPISIMQYSKGTRIDGKGDPSMSRVVPNEQFVSEAFFPVYRFQSNMSTINTTYLEITTDCEYVNSVSLSRSGEDIQHIIGNDTLEEVTQAVLIVTDSPEKLTHMDVANIAIIIKNITDVKPSNPKITSILTTIVKNFADIDQTDLYEIESSTGAISVILTAFEDHLKVVALNDENVTSKYSPNVYVQISDVVPADLEVGLNLSMRQINFTHASSDPDQQFPLEIDIPQSVFDNLEEPTKENEVRVALTMFRTSSLYASSNHKEINENRHGLNRSVNSLIAGLTIGGKKLTNLEDDIVFSFKPIRAGYQNPTCAFWDIALPDWSTSGSRHITSSGDRSSGLKYNTSEPIVCSCDHLTNFAVLMT
ncbi:adhesion G-protein coupled receptor G6-like [Lytechinus pictus]|uniref:adhesion G-protein coupled receptor G6-like n=1 Tax=Lytechinus pictus TaxID=7653 RepID=UPI0030BA0D0C